MTDFLFFFTKRNNNEKNLKKKSPTWKTTWSKFGLYVNVMKYVPYTIRWIEVIDDLRDSRPREIVFWPPTVHSRLERIDSCRVKMIKSASFKIFCKIFKKEGISAMDEKKKKFKFFSCPSYYPPADWMINIEPDSKVNIWRLPFFSFWRWNVGIGRRKNIFLRFLFYF